MIYAQLVVKNILRNRRRAFLTAMSVAVSIFLLVILAAESIPIELSFVFLHPLAQRVVHKVGRPSGLTRLPGHSIHRRQPAHSTSVARTDSKASSAWCRRSGWSRSWLSPGGWGALTSSHTRRPYRCASRPFNYGVGWGHYSTPSLLWSSNPLESRAQSERLQVQSHLHR
jgi:hypothetical protein